MADTGLGSYLSKMWIIVGWPVVTGERNLNPRMYLSSLWIPRGQGRTNETLLCLCILFPSMLFFFFVDRDTSRGRNEGERTLLHLPPVIVWYSVSRQGFKPQYLAI